MKTLVIILLILVVLGLWFYADATKGVIKTAGLVTKEVGEDLGQKISENVEEKLEENNLSKELKDLLPS